MTQTSFERTIEEISTEWLERDRTISALLTKNKKRYAAAAGRLFSSLHTDSMVLDWGCGLPILHVLLSAKCNEFVSFEPHPSEAQLRFAEHYGFSISQNLPECQQFHAITMIEVIEHIPILKNVMTEVAERLAPGGRLIATTPNGMRFQQWIAFVRRQRAHPVPIETFLRNDNTHEHHQREFTAAELRRSLEFFGLTVEELLVTDISPSRDDYAQSLEILGKPASRRRSWARIFQGWLPSSWQQSIICCAVKPEEKRE